MTRILSADLQFECILCRSHHRTLIHQKVRGDKTGKVQVVRCDNCRHKQLSHPFYDLELYRADEQVQFSIEAGGTSLDRFIENSWTEAERRLDRLLSDCITPIKKSEICALDVGSGYGFFGYLLNRKLINARVETLEPSIIRVKAGKEQIVKKYGNSKLPKVTLGILDNEFANRFKNNYSLITIWHVLEHVPDPESLIRNAWNLLEPGGWLSLEVPNSEDDLLELSTGFADYAYMIEHISYFSSQVLSDLVAKVTGTPPDKIYGYQRYGLLNYLNWTHSNAPLGENPDYFPGEARSWIEELWLRKRLKDKTTDALVLNVKKPAENGI